MRHASLLTAVAVLLSLLAPTGPATASDATASAPAPAPVGRDRTLELRDAFLGVDGTRAWSAGNVLARPSDPAGGGEITWDPAAPRAQACGPQICVHYVTTTSDAPPMTSTDGVTPDWVLRNLEVAQYSLATMVDRLGYPAPPSDGGRGGTAQFDIYLADIGSSGLYGYCAPEKRVPGERSHASSYCVFDDDFAGFPMPPDASLRVTAAHELFHAVQFAMDVTEDVWFLESTATWMEEQVADDVDDNRQFLPAGQLGRRQVPLDRGSADLTPYGNWIFFQRLAQRYGVDAVRRVWALADGGPGRPDHFSVGAVRRFVESRRPGSWPAFYAGFVAANADPARGYAEGTAYRRARPDQRVRLSRQRPTWRQRRMVLPHLTGRVVRVRADAGLRGRVGLRVRIDAGPRRSSPAARVVVHRSSGKVTAQRVPLDRQGRGSRRVDLTRGRVRSVEVVLANASTRYDCDRRSQFACRGLPLDDEQSFDVTLSVVR